MPENIPFSLDAEACTLGSMILDQQGEVVPDVREILVAGDFYRPAHQVLYGALCALHDRDVPVDIVLIKNELIKGRQLEAVGGVEYLMGLMTGVPNAMAASHYAEIVKGKSVLRGLILIGQGLSDKAHDPQADGREVAAEVEQALYELSEIRVSRCLVGDAAGQVLDDSRAVQEGKTPIALKTGFPAIDEPIGGGLRPGQSIVVSGGTSKGKSVLVGDIARNIARNNGGVLFVTGEMLATELTTRWLAAETGIYTSKFTRGALTGDDWRSADEARIEIDKWRMEIIDRSLTIPDVASAARRAANRWRHKGGLSLVVVDYLGLMTPPKANTREQEVGEMARMCKVFAAQLGVPWLVVHQFNRAIHDRPELHNLRDSGQTEQHASGVWLIYWPDGGERIDDSLDGPYIEVLLKIAKCRGGKTTTWDDAIRLKFRRLVTRMESDYGLG